VSCSITGTAYAFRSKWKSFRSTANRPGPRGYDGRRNASRGADGACRRRAKGGTSLVSPSVQPLRRGASAGPDEPTTPVRAEHGDTAAAGRLAEPLIRDDLDPRTLPSTTPSFLGVSR
jgi:hypothetical protein